MFKFKSFDANIVQSVIARSLLISIPLKYLKKSSVRKIIDDIVLLYYNYESHKMSIYGHFITVFIRNVEKETQFS